MRLYYYADPKKNFGDDLNEWIWDRLLPGLLDDSKEEWMSGIGSIIHDSMPDGRKKVVFSSGAGCGYAPFGFGNLDWNVISVRGPLTAEVFNLPESAAVTDGAILLRLLEEYSPLPESERNGIVFMPHHSCIDFSEWEEVCHRAGIDFVSPRDDSRQTVERLRRAKLVLADAMHAAIVADTLRVPWIPIVASPITNGFKWLDWTLSVELPYEPVKVPASNLSESVTGFVFNALGGMYARGDNRESALRDYRRKFLDRNPKIWKLERRLRYKVSGFLRKLINVLLQTSIGKKQNEKYMERSACGLISASKSKPFLSNDEVFENRLREMKGRLEQVRNILS